jgi:hypothetical protein
MRYMRYILMVAGQARVVTDIVADFVQAKRMTLQVTLLGESVKLFIDSLLETLLAPE